MLITLVQHENAMRRILIASLFLSIVMLHVQTATKHQNVIMEASNSAPTISAVSSDVYAMPRHRVSTGVIEPHLLWTLVADLRSSDFNSIDPSPLQLKVYVRLDDNGVPMSVKVVKPVNPTIDRQVLEALRRHHFTPGMADNWPVASDLYLRINSNVQ